MEVVILCGGKGTRAYPFSDLFPKVMMPIGGTPILVHLMRIYADQGFDKFILAAGHRKEILYDYFEGRFTNWDVRIVDTGADSDTGERVRRCADYASKDFFCTYGDGLGDVDLVALKRFHESHASLATLTTVPLHSQYGTVHFDGMRCVERFQEKPVISDCWINAGFFVFQNSVFASTRGQNLERDVLPELAAKGSLFAYQHDSFWKSMDTSKDQLEMEELLRNGMAPWVRRHAHAASAR
ncbi:MAG TPA: sugar phosphate nucleotidyltransferase [Paludibaculum sp.]|jgi:glucose-1-phosphate cytidylyltransferase